MVFLRTTQSEHSAVCSYIVGDINSTSTLWSSTTLTSRNKQKIIIELCGLNFEQIIRSRWKVIGRLRVQQTSDVSSMIHDRSKFISEAITSVSRQGLRYQAVTYTITKSQMGWMFNFGAFSLKKANWTLERVQISALFSSLLYQQRRLDRSTVSMTGYKKSCKTFSLSSHMNRQKLLRSWTPYGSSNNRNHHPLINSKFSIRKLNLPKHSNTNNMNTKTDASSSLLLNQILCQLKSF